MAYYWIDEEVLTGISPSFFSSSSFRSSTAYAWAATDLGRKGLRVVRGALLKVDRSGATADGFAHIEIRDLNPNRVAISLRKSSCL